MLTIFEETGEVRAPKKGEWFNNTAGMDGVFHAHRAEYDAPFWQKRPILTRITADTWEELKRKVEEGTVSWNYRIVHHKEKNGEEWHGIHEVYYNADGAPCMMTEEPCGPVGETKKELMNDLSMMTEALIKPVLEYDMEFAEYKPLDKLAKKIKRNGGIKEADRG